MKTFWKLLEKSVIARVSLAITVTVFAFILWLRGQELPDLLAMMIGSAWTWFFATKAPQDFVDVVMAEKAKPC